MQGGVTQMNYKEEESFQAIKTRKDGINTRSVESYKGDLEDLVAAIKINGLNEDYLNTLIDLLMHLSGKDLDGICQIFIEEELIKIAIDEIRSNTSYLLLYIQIIQYLCIAFPKVIDDMHDIWEYLVSLLDSEYGFHALQLIKICVSKNEGFKQFFLQDDIIWSLSQQNSLIYILTMLYVITESNNFEQITTIAYYFLNCITLMQNFDDNCKYYIIKGASAVFSKFSPDDLFVNEYKKHIRKLENELITVYYNSDDSNILVQLINLLAIIEEMNITYINILMRRFGEYDMVNEALTLIVLKEITKMNNDAFASDFIMTSSFSVFISSQLDLNARTMINIASILSSLIIRGLYHPTHDEYSLLADAYEESHGENRTIIKNALLISYWHIEEEEEISEPEID